MTKLDQDIRDVTTARDWWRLNRRADIVFRSELPTDRGERALCDRYRADGCKGCPVRWHTRKPMCEGTPAHLHPYWTIELDEHARAYTPQFVDRWWRVLSAEMVSLLNEIRTKLVRERQHERSKA